MSIQDQIKFIQNLRHSCGDHDGGKAKYSFKQVEDSLNKLKFVMDFWDKIVGKK